MAFLFFAAHLVAFVSLPSFLVRHLGIAPANVGWTIAPLAFSGALAAPLAARLVSYLSAETVGIAGLGLLASGIAAVALAPSHPSIATIAWRVALIGVGFGLFQTPNFNRIIEQAPGERSGAAWGLQTLCRLLGQATGSTCAAVGPRYTDQIPSLPLCIAGAIGLAAFVLALVFARSSSGEGLRPARFLA